ncbi:hypothetical protein ACH47Z_24745 [Streptomyces sp. NPDC020192]|uniref:cyanase n=1 Tax=Streptomyces sp. NPDC020192 TaxID=3365066 RepID=UPI0037A9E254
MVCGGGHAEDLVEGDEPGPLSRRGPAARAGVRLRTGRRRPGRASVYGTTLKALVHEQFGDGISPPSPSGSRRLGDRPVEVAP